MTERHILGIKSSGNLDYINDDVIIYSGSEVNESINQGRFAEMRAIAEPIIIKFHSKGYTNTQIAIEINHSRSYVNNILKSKGLKYNI